MQISKYISNMRAEKNMSVLSFAHLHNVSHTYVQKIEKGEMDIPSPLVAARIAKTFNFDPSLFTNLFILENPYIENKESFSDEFNSIYYSTIYANDCERVITEFKNKLFTDKVVGSSKSGILSNFSDGGIEFLDANDTSRKYPGVNAVIKLCSLYPEKYADYEINIIYLPGRRINDGLNDFIDFSNKLAYLEHNKKGNNIYIFVTPSINVFNFIRNNYLKNAIERYYGFQPFVYLFLSRLNFNLQYIELINDNLMFDIEPAK